MGFFISLLIALVFGIVLVGIVTGRRGGGSGRSRDWGSGGGGYVPLSDSGSSDSSWSSSDSDYSSGGDSSDAGGGGDSGAGGDGGGGDGGGGGD